MKKISNWIKKEFNETRDLLRKMPGMLIALFILSLVLMNILANKSIDLGKAGEWLALDAGILMSGFIFIVLDTIVRHFGPKSATRMTVVAILANLFVSGVFLLASVIPGFWGESFIEVGGEIANTALDNTIAGTWYVLLGSTIAFLISSIINNFTNWGLSKFVKEKDKYSFKAYAFRSYISTFIGQFFDNLIFALLVSVHFFGWSYLQAFMCALTGAVIELLMQLVISPIGYKLSEKWRAKGLGIYGGGQNHRQ